MTDDLTPYRRGMEFGIGIDSPSADSRNVGVIGEATSIPNASGSLVSFNLTQISSDDDLQTSLGLSAEGKMVGPFSASATMEFAHKCHVHTNSVFLLVTVEVNLAFAQIRNPKIAPEAAAKLADGNTTRFQEMYGDVFVRGMQTGGRFFAVVEVFTSSRTEQESLSASLKGSYGAYSAKGTFSSEFSEAITNKSLKITVHHEGGVVPKEPTSLEEVQAIAATFAASVEGHAVPYAALLDKYSILDLPSPPNYVDLQNQMEVLAFCARQRNSLWTAMNAVDYVFANPGQFEIGPGKYDVAQLVAYRTALEADLATVTKSASVAVDHPRDAALPVLTAKPPAMPTRREGEEDTMAAMGEAIANADPLLAAVRDAQPVGDCRRGFYVGLVVEAKNCWWGPGSQRIKDGLNGAEQVGFAIAAALCLPRNRNPEVAARGAAVVKADPEVKAARALDQPAGVAWLGFDLGTGVFGDPAKGAIGSTVMGPGAERIRASLDADGQRGFDAARAFNVGRRH